MNTRFLRLISAVIHSFVHSFIHSSIFIYLFVFIFFVYFVYLFIYLFICYSDLLEYFPINALFEITRFSIIRIFSKQYQFQMKKNYWEGNERNWKVRSTICQAFQVQAWLPCCWRFFARSKIILCCGTLNIMAENHVLFCL